VKFKFWICAWCVIIVICLVKGVSTRASYAIISPNSAEVLNSYYAYSVDTGMSQKEMTDTNYTTLASQAKLIVTCRFDGVREVKNKSLLSEVKVENVIQGNKSLKGQKIKIDEPINTRFDNIKYHDIANDFNEMVKKFGWQGKTHVLVSSPEGISNAFTYAIMGENQDCLLFLNPPELLPGQRLTGETGYMQLDNPYAKITISDVDASTYKPPTGEISFKEAMQYEIFLQEPSSIKVYFATKIEILKQLHLL
jgi:hypothetical protein